MASRRSPATSAIDPPEEAEQPDLTGLEVAISALVRWSESRYIRSEVARLSGYDVAPSVIRLLEHFDAAGAMRVGEVAHCLGIDVSTASLQLKPLRRDDLVESTRDPQDGRSSTIAITPKGRKVLTHVRAARRLLLAQTLGDVPAAEVERAAAVLLRVQDAMLADL